MIFLYFQVKNDIKTLGKHASQHHLTQVGIVSFLVINSCREENVCINIKAAVFDPPIRLLYPSHHIESMRHRKCVYVSVRTNRKQRSLKSVAQKEVRLWRCLHVMHWLQNEKKKESHMTSRRHSKYVYEQLEKKEV